MLHLVLAAAAATSAQAFLFAAPPALTRHHQLASTSSGDDAAAWMSDYLVKVHEARLDAVARARAEAKAESERRIADLEAQLAAAQGGASAAAPAPATIEPPVTASPSASLATAEMNAAYAARSSKGEIAPATEKNAGAAQPSKAYTERNSNKAAVSSRWGSEEISRISA